MLAWLNDISYELKFPFVGSGDFKIYIYKEKETKGMKNEMKKKNNKGFSLVELIVVIAIMAVLMVVLAPAMLRYVEKARVQKDESAAAEVRNAVELALADEQVVSTLPETISDVTVRYNTTDKKWTIAGGTSELLTEVKKTISESKIAFTSKTHKEETYTIKITGDVDKGYVVTGKWPDETSTQDSK